MGSGSSRVPFTYDQRPRKFSRVPFSQSAPACFVCMSALPPYSSGTRIKPTNTGSMKYTAIGYQNNTIGERYRDTISNPRNDHAARLCQRFLVSRYNPAAKGIYVTYKAIDFSGFPYFYCPCSDRSCTASFTHCGRLIDLRKELSKSSIFEGFSL